MRARRTGRRPGDSGTREAILAAARTSFGAAGYRATTIRGVAGAAGVDPALVHHYFGSKGQLFAAAMELPTDPAQLLPALLTPGVHGLGERLVRTFLAIWDATPGQGPLLALLRSALGHDEAAGMLREFLTSAILGPLASAVGASSPELRASLAASQMIGLAVARYVVRLEPLASADPDALALAMGPTLQRYLTGELLPGAAQQPGATAGPRTPGESPRRPAGETT